VGDWTVLHGGRSFPIGVVVFNVFCLLVTFPEGTAVALGAISLAYCLQLFQITSFPFELLDGVFLGVFAVLAKALMLLRSKPVN